MTGTFALKENSNTPSSQEAQPTLKNFESESIQVSWVLSSRDTGEKNTISFSLTRYQERLLLRHSNPDLRLRPPRWSSLRRISVGLKHYWSIWETMEPKTTKQKYCKTFYAKIESVMRLPEDAALNQMDWARDSTSLLWTRLAAYLSMQTWLPSSDLILHIMQCSSTITSLILPSITTRIQMTLIESHLIFRSSTSSVVFVTLFNCQSLYISWRKDQQKDSFLELILLATKFWIYKAKLLM